MKVGDKVPVHVGGHVVAQAEVREINSSESTATLVVPATLVVMGVRSELTDLPGTEPTTDTIITGVDRDAGAAEATASDPTESATGSEPVNNSGNATGNSDNADANSSNAEQVVEQATSVETEPVVNEVPTPAPKAVVPEGE